MVATGRAPAAVVGPTAYRPSPSALIDDARRSWRMLAVLLAVPILLAGAASVARSPVYEAQTKLFVGRQAVPEGELGSTNGIAQATLLLVRSYAEVVTTEPVAREVVRRMGLGEPAHEVLDRVRAVPVADTQLMRIAVRSGSRDEARDLADTFARVFIERVQADAPGVGIPVGVVEPAVAARAPVSPKPVRDLALAIVAGGVACWGYLRLRRHLGGLEITTRAEPAPRVDPAWSNGPPRPLQDPATERSNGSVEPRAPATQPHESQMPATQPLESQMPATEATETRKPADEPPADNAVRTSPTDRSGVTMIGVPHEDAAGPALASMSDEDWPDRLAQLVASRAARVVAVTGRPATTSLSIRLGRACADAGLTTVVVAADPTNHHAAAALDMVGRAGLSDFVDGAPRVVQRTAHDRLFVVPPGRNPRPVEAADLRRLLDRLLAEAPIVVLDAPPAPPSDDWSSLADAVVVVAPDAEGARTHGWPDVPVIAAILESSAAAAAGSEVEQVLEPDGEPAP